MSPPRRFGSDAPEIIVIAEWGRKALPLRGIAATILGLAIAAHFGNNLQTMAFASSALMRARTINWTCLERRLQECKDVCGTLHSPNCRSCNLVCGQVGAASYAANAARVFRAMFEHKAFQKACQLLSAGIHTRETFGEVYDLFSKGVRKDVPGSWAPYHFKLFLDHLVAGKFVARGCVSKWPVAPTSGTARFLVDLHGLPRAGDTTLRTLLNELVHRLRVRGALGPTDYQGTIGAALCWLQRKAAPERYRRTVRQAEIELRRLRELAVALEPLAVILIPTPVRQDQATDAFGAGRFPNKWIVRLAHATWQDIPAPCQPALPP